MPSTMFHDKEFQALGRHVHEAWRKKDFAELDFPQIAANAAANFDVGFAFSPVEVAGFLGNTTIRQQPTNTFSNLPITVYRHEKFYIELLVWTQATTEIHEHAFSGAFRVLQGSSLHTRYKFLCDDEVTPDFRIGRLETHGSEQLSKGSTQAIMPGSQGLVHSLYHLECPSVTMVIRTPGLAAYQPQHAFYLPNLCFNIGYFVRDDLVQMLQKLLIAAAQADKRGASEVWLDHIARLDCPRLAWMLVSHCDTLEQSGFWAELQARIRQQHGQRANSIFEAMAEQRRVLDLVKARTVINDPDLRFFLALLMNIRDKETLLEHLATKYPGTPPLEKCANFLARLSTGRTDAARMLATLASQAGSYASDLGRLLESALPSKMASSSERARLYFHLLSLDTSDGGMQALEADFPDSSPDALREFVKRIRDLPQVAQLFGPSSGS